MLWRDRSWLPPTSPSSPSPSSSASSSSTASPRWSPRACPSQSGCQSISKVVVNAKLSCSSSGCCGSCSRGSRVSWCSWCCSNSGGAGASGGGCDGCSCGTHAHPLFCANRSRGTVLSHWCDKGHPRFSAFPMWASQACWIDNNRCVAETLVRFWFVIFFWFRFVLVIC